MANHSDVTPDPATRGTTISRLPSGRLTFLFTDIEGSTRLLQRLGDSYVPLLDDHNRILREAIAAHGGFEVRPIGDAIFAVFPDPGDAVRAVLAAQLALRAHRWPPEVDCRVRMGLHTGVATSTGDDYIGLAVHTASRISDAGHGGQILLSSETAGLAADTLPEGTELHDLGTHRLRDIIEPQRIFEVHHPDLPEVDAPLRTLSARPNNLPVQLTSFIGRDKEMTDLKALLLSGTRVITLVGPGGCGKTRLSVEVASELLGDYPDGVWFVELAEVSSDALVVQAVAAALGIQEEPGRELGQTLTSRLEGSHALLVLDNCEHVVWGAAELASWVLQTCPGVQVLATSREPLSVAGETTWVVPPLSVPQNGHLTERADAVRLFVDRAQAVNPRLELTPESTELVGEICRRLDGIPLALELAAARMDVLSLGQISERLDNRFKLLTRGSRTAMPRQQTLRALVDWSFDLLGPHEQVLLCRLAVFAGGFTLEAAEAVGAGDPVEDEDVLDALAGLVRRSLVQVDDADGDHRYRLLETIRQYGLEKLEARGEALDVRGRHRRWLADFAASTRDIDFTSTGAAIHDRLELEAGNIRVALESGLADPGGVAEALQICADLGYFWWLRGHISEGETWIAAVLSKAGNEDPVPRGFTIVWRALLAIQGFDFDTALPLLHEALAVGEEHGNDLLKARALTWLTTSMAVLGRAEEAREFLTQRLAGGDDMIEEPERAGWLYLLGSVYQLLGDRDASRRALDEAIEIGRRVRGSYVLGRALPTAAGRALDRGDATLARELYTEALHMARETNDRVALARCLVYFAEASTELGDFETAESHLREATPIITIQIGFLVLRARLEVAKGRLAFNRARLDEARDRVRHALELELGTEKAVEDAHLLLGAIELAAGDVDAAEPHIREALEVTEHLDDADLRGRALELSARVALERGDLEQAHLHLLQATTLAEGMGSEVQRAAALHARGLLALARDDMPAALESLDHALGLRTAIGNELAVAESMEALAAAAEAGGDLERAASMLGAAEARRAQLSCPAPAAAARAIEALQERLRKSGFGAT